MIDDWDRGLKLEDEEYFLSNKIKRCKVCHNELNYIEKFNSTDKVCNQCHLSKSKLVDPNGGEPGKAKYSARLSLNEKIKNHHIMIKNAEREYFNKNQ